MATDPVCGMQVDESSATETIVHEGQPYYFCCKGCRMEFEDDPGRYMGGSAGAHDDAGAHHADHHM